MGNLRPEGNTYLSRSPLNKQTTHGIREVKINSGQGFHEIGLSQRNNDLFTILLLFAGIRHEVELTFIQNVSLVQYVAMSLAVLRHSSSFYYLLNPVQMDLSLLTVSELNVAFPPLLPTEINDVLTGFSAGNGM